jgi:hypothetical protein
MAHCSLGQKMHLVAEKSGLNLTNSYFQTHIVHGGSAFPMTMINDVDVDGKQK